jgi:hypothetical protein
MGFEPTTFCMASRRRVGWERPKCLHFPGFAASAVPPAFEELRPITVDLDTEWTPSAVATASPSGALRRNVRSDQVPVRTRS